MRSILKMSPMILILVASAISVSLSLGINNKVQALECPVGQVSTINNNYTECVQTANAPQESQYTEANGSCSGIIAKVDDCAVKSDYRAILAQAQPAPNPQPQAPPVAPNPQPQAPPVAADPDATPDPAAEEEEKPTCGTMAPGVGWWMCPLTSAAALFADGIWKLFEIQLVTDPLQDNGPYYELWGSLRNIANAILAILFLFIIMSQVSNLGISNYGIKKTLPKLLLMAIAINVSFFIVQIAVDLANALGSSLLGFIEAQTPALPPRGTTGLLEEGMVALGALGAGVGLTVAAGIMVGPMAVIIFFLLILIPGVIGIIAGFLTLVIRESVIPFLAVLAPLAFVAYALPNTQSLFTKWRKIFTAFLILYPAAAIFYGAVKFATILIVTDPGSGFFESMIAWAVLFTSMIAIPFMLFKGNSATAKMFGALQKGVGKATGLNAVEKLGKQAMGARSKLGFQRFKNSGPKPVKSGIKGLTPRQLSRKGMNRIRSGVQAYDRSSRNVALDTEIEKKRADQAYQADSAGRQDQLRDLSLRSDVQSKSQDQEYRQNLLNDPERVNELRQTAAGRGHLRSIEGDVIKAREEPFLNQQFSFLQASYQEAARNRDLTTMKAIQGVIAKHGGEPAAGQIKQLFDSVDNTMDDASYAELATDLADNHGGLMGKDVALKQMLTNIYSDPDNEGNVHVNRYRPTTNADGSINSGTQTAFNEVARNSSGWWGNMTASKFAGLSRDQQTEVLSDNRMAQAIPDKILRDLVENDTISNSITGNNEALVKQLYDTKFGGQPSGGSGQSAAPVTGPGSTITFSQAPSGLFVPNNQPSGGTRSSAPATVPVIPAQGPAPQAPQQAPASPPQSPPPAQGPPNPSGGAT